jgi:predicted Zn-dependent protease
MIASEDLRDYAGLATQGLQLMFLKFSRDDERQADDLGLRYLVRADYDPHEMPPVFRTLERVSQAHGGGRIPVWASTHPDPGRRAERIAQDIQGLPAEARQGKILREEYLQRLEGLVFGSDPRQGYTVGSAYYHPELEFRLQFPDGWEIVNQRQAVFALSPSRDAVLVLTLAAEDSPEAESESFFRQQGIERGRQWRPGFHYFATVPTSEQPQRLVGLAGFFSHRDTTYRLLGYTTEEEWREHETELERSAASFSPVSDRRYLDVQPRRLELLRLPETMSFDSFARRYPSTVDETSLAILNGVSGDHPLEAGKLYKRVVGGDIPDS